MKNIIKYIIKIILISVMAGLLLGTAGLSAEKIKADQIFLTPEDFGAIGNDKKDDTKALQALFTSKHKKIIFIPGKEYLLSDTIKLPPRKGLHVMGVGFSANLIKKKIPVTGNVSRIVWWGDSEDKAMIEYNGGGMIWNGVTLVGWYYDKKVKAKICIKINKVAKGLKQSTIHFTSLGLERSIYGIQVGNENEPTPQVYDRMLFDYFRGLSFKTAFYFADEYYAGVYWSYLNCNYSQRVLYFAKGGMAHAQSVGCHSGTKNFLVIGDQGKKTGFYSFFNSKIDAQETHIKFVVMEKPGPAVINFENWKRSRIKRNYDYSKVFQIKGPASLSLRNCEGMVKDEAIYTESTSKGYPNILLDRCKLNYSSIDKMLSKDNKGKNKFRIRNCYIGGGFSPVDDQEN